MNKKPLLPFIIIFLFFINLSENLFPASKYAKPRLFIKLQGNVNFLDGGLFKEMINGNLVFFETLRNSGNDYIITTDEDPFFTGYGAEIGIEAGKYAVGLDLSFLSSQYIIDYEYNDQKSGYQYRYLWDHQFSAIPIFINNYFKIIDGSFLTSFFTVGVGIYVAKFDYSLKETWVNNPLTYRDTVLESKRNFLGIHLGISLQLNINKNISILLETKYRYVGLKDLSGTMIREFDTGTSEAEGELIYLIWKNGGKGKFWIGDYDEEFYYEQPVSLNMNGFALTGGIKITFGSRGK